MLGRLSDLDGWAQGLAAALQSHGELLVFDDHPVALCVDGLQRWHRDYFEDGIARLGRIVTALAHAGLGVEALEEYPVDASGRRHDRRVPASFLLYARKA